MSNQTIEDEIKQMLISDPKGMDVIECAYGFMNRAMSMISNVDDFGNNDISELADSAILELQNIDFEDPYTDPYKKAMGYFISMNCEIMRTANGIFKFINDFKDGIDNPESYINEITKLNQDSLKSYYLLGKSLIEFSNVPFRDQLPSYKLLKETVNQHRNGFLF